MAELSAAASAGVVASERDARLATKLYVPVRGRGSGAAAASGGARRGAFPGADLGVCPSRVRQTAQLADWVRSGDRRVARLSLDAADSDPVRFWRITFTLAPQLGAEGRNVRYVGYGAFAPRAERIALVRAFLDESGVGAARRQRMQGDASTRIFERLTLDDKTMILMNAPPRPDGPPVRDGKPYSAIAHLAEDTIPYVALARGLRDRNLSAPEILHADPARGLIVMEDLGEVRIVDGDPPAPIEARYEAAIDVLISLHRRKLPETLPIAPHFDYRLPRYDADAFLIEAELLLDWYLPSVDAPPTDDARDAFAALWRNALRPALEAPPTWVLRDYHSPNLLWLADRDDVARIGVLDFQDAVIGPGAYDVASILQDARVDVPEAHGGGAAQPLRPRPSQGRCEIRHRRLHPALCDARGAARDKNPRHLCPARPPRRQAAIPASHAAHMELSATRAGASGARHARRLVCHQCARPRCMMGRIGQRRDQAR